MTREEAIKVMFYVKNHFWNDAEVNTALDMGIEALQEQKTGKWYEDEEVGLCRCDQCQAVNLIHTPFCPMCGTRMECEEE